MTKVDQLVKRRGKVLHELRNSQLGIREHGPLV